MKDQITLAIEYLNEGKVVAIPTETVYGLAANAFDEKAILKIFEIKNRPLFNPLIVHIKSIEYLDQVAENIPPIAMQLAEKFWPGPLTLVLPKKEYIPDCVTAGKKTIAVRVPSHAITLELLEKLKFPLAAPSANPFGYISPTKVEHVKSQLGNKVPLILEGGPCEMGIESTIIGFNDQKPILYRLGAIPQEAIEMITGKIELLNKTKNSPESPGMINKHYAPKTTFKTSNDMDRSIIENIAANVGFLLFSNPKTDINPHRYERLSQTDNMVEAAQNLYAAMHHLDQKNFDLIIAEMLPDKGIGKSLNDRLLRAQETSFEFDFNNH